MIWHLYDYYLEPAGGYFGARKANEPLHIQFSYDDRSVVVVNSLYRPIQGLTATAELYDFGLHKTFSHTVSLDAAEDSAQRLFTIPEAGPESSVSFVKLLLQDRNEQTVSSNFYWLPAKYSTFEWKDTTFVHTPSPSYEDFSQLSHLPNVKLQMQTTTSSSVNKRVVKVKLTNPGGSLAFQVCLRVFNKKDGHDILPVLWDDNYFALMPGESRTITAAYDPKQIRNVQPVVEVAGWNIVPETRILSGSFGQ